MIITRRLFRPFCMGALLLILSVSGYTADDSMRASLFKNADKLLQEAKDTQADVLAPESYSAASRAYQKAEERLKGGQSIEKIRRDLDKAIAYFKTSIEASRLGEVTFNKAMQARSDAKAAQSSEYATESWQKAESQFASAARTLEDGNVKRAKKTAAAAESLYRDAELAAIKANYLSETRKLIDSARKAKVDRYAPKTLNNAASLLSQAEKGLSEDRYDTDKPRLLAKQAKTEAKHAIYIADIAGSLRNKTLTPEDFILQTEKPLVEIASALDLVIEFDEGLEQPTKFIRQQINNLQQDSHELAERQNQILALETELQTLEQKLGVQSERLAKQEAHRKRLKQVEGLFTPSEAIVMSQKGNVVIRTIGLNFQSGSSQIESRYFNLLKKVQKAISEYPDGAVVIEGHTDSFGSDEANLALSEKRADAVKQYLLANMAGSQGMQINAVGYGESRPIGNNETSEGRTKNRRIDLVLKPLSY